MRISLAAVGAVAVAAFTALGVGVGTAASSAADPAAQRAASVRPIHPAAVTAIPQPPGSGDQAGEQEGNDAKGEADSQEGAGNAEQEGKGAKGEADPHEDAGNAEHQCPPDCDTAGGEAP